MRLDNFAADLQRNPQNQGAVVSYGGKTSTVRQRSKVGQKVKNYLVRIRKISPERIKLIDGGPRKEKQVEVYILSPQACPPIPYLSNDTKQR